MDKLEGTDDPMVQTLLTSESRVLSSAASIRTPTGVLDASVAAVTGMALREFEASSVDSSAKDMPGIPSSVAGDSVGGSISLDIVPVDITNGTAAGRRKREHALNRMEPDRRSGSTGRREQNPWCPRYLLVPVQGSMRQELGLKRQGRQALHRKS
eukprot:scaffold98016_cov32-Tisochrysis_lutea.AAC.1